MQGQTIGKIINRECKVASANQGSETESRDDIVRWKENRTYIHICTRKDLYWN